MGFTLVEMMIALAVVGLMLGVGVVGIRRATQANLRDAAVEITAMLREAYERATRSGLHQRVVFDLSEQVLRLETCEGSITLRKTDEEEVSDEKDIERVRETAERMQRALQAPRTLASAGQVSPSSIPEIVSASSPEKAVEAAAALAGVLVGSARCHLAQGRSGLADGLPLIRAVDKESGISIRRIHVQHLREPVSDGLVSINFFPLGYAEKAVVEVVDKNGGEYLLLVHRLTGKVEVRRDDFDPEDHMRRDGAGDTQREIGR